MAKDIRFTKGRGREWSAEPDVDSPGFVRLTHRNDLMEELTAPEARVLAMRLTDAALKSEDTKLDNEKFNSLAAIAEQEPTPALLAAASIRPTRDEWALSVAKLTAERATCHRRRVGCVLLNARGHVLATGYNGNAAGLAHCNELVGAGFPNRCPGSDAPAGKPNGCQSIHAEQNALLQCRDVYAIDAAFITDSPCMVCVKLLLNTSCQRVVFTNEYPHPEAKALWESAGRTWEHRP